MGLENIMDTSKFEVLSVSTEQRIALGNLLATLPKVKHIVVYDINEQTLYVWSGKEWV